MELTSDIIELKFTGNTISPDLVSIDELTNIIRFLDNALRPVLIQEHPELDFDKFYIGILNVEPGSLRIRYRLKEHISVVRSSFASILLAVSTHNYGALPEDSINEFVKLTNFNTKYNCKANFNEVKQNEVKELFSFYDEINAAAAAVEKEPDIKGSTTVYGYVNSVGGKNPKASIITVNGEKINAEISIENAKKAATKLYEPIRVKGFATWDAKSLKIKAFKVEELLDYDDISTDEAFERLGNSIGKYWDDIDNINDILN